MRCEHVTSHPIDATANEDNPACPPKELLEFSCVYAVLKTDNSVETEIVPRTAVVRSPNWFEVPRWAALLKIKSVIGKLSLFVTNVRDALTRIFGQVSAHQGPCTFRL